MAGDVGSAAVTSEPADESATADSEPAPESAETVVADTRWRKVVDSPVRLALTLGVVVVLGLSALAGWLGTDNEVLILALIFGVLYVLAPVLAGVGAAWLSRGLAGGERIRVVLGRYAPAVVPLGFAIWFAHYWFHFASGALTIIPVLQSFMIDHGVALLGSAPNWRLGAILPANGLFLLELGSVLIGFLASLAVLRQIADNAHNDSRMARRAMTPWLVLLVLVAVLAVTLFTLPMEMRGMMTG